jgi:spermidine synthase
VSAAAPRHVALVTGLFFLSGSAGLVYQVLWMRSLGLFFGSDMYGVSIILSTFMGGLALGSLLGGRIAEGSRRPLLWYGAAELGIGAFALLFPGLLDAFDPLLRAVYADSSSGPVWSYQLVRVLLAAATLLIPTTLMGATLPLILRHFVRSRSVVGELAAFFYSVNTLGALVGTLAAGFLLLPYLGMTTSTLCVAALNLSIGGVCALLGWSAPLPAELRAQPERRRVELDTLPELDTPERLRIARAALLALGLSGAASFALEVVWTRILVMSFSATVYSFASMLACFLFGIFLGSLLIAPVVDRHRAPLGLFAALELGIGVSVAVLCLLIDAIPGFFGHLLVAAAALGGPAGGLVIATLAASLALLIVPTTLLGATFSVALRAYTTNASRIGIHTGRLYFANTCGAIVGSLGAGLLLIPAIGTRASLALIALLFTAIGMLLAAVQSGRGARVRVPVPAAAATLAVVLATGFALAAPHRVALNFNQDMGTGTELLYHADGIQSTVDVVRSGTGVTSLVIGGNIEANDEYTQLRHFVLKGHLPLMFLEDPGSVLVIGLGMGITLNATVRHGGVERVEVIELAPEVVEAQAHLRKINGDVARNPLVDIRIDDGRSFLKMTSKRYDMITADPIHPKISRVGYLYTRDYYELIRSHLREGGVVCQWMPLYQISPTRLRSAIKTFASVFPNATLWHVKKHALFVAKKGAVSIDYALLQRKFAQPALREDLASIGIDGPEALLSLLLMGPAEIRDFVNQGAGVPENTDDHPYLEYFVPGDLFYDDLDNVREIVKHLADPARFVTGLPHERAAELRALTAGRAERLLSQEAAAPAHFPACEGPGAASDECEYAETQTATTR